MNELIEWVKEYGEYYRRPITNPDEFEPIRRDGGKYGWYVKLVPPPRCKSTDGRTVDGWIYQLCDECYDKHINRLSKIIDSYEDKLKSREENISKETD